MQVKKKESATFSFKDLTTDEATILVQVVNSIQWSTLNTEAYRFLKALYKDLTDLLDDIGDFDKVLGEDARSWLDSES